MALLITPSRAQWVQSSGPLGPDVRAVLVSDGTLYAGTSAGIFVLPAGGMTWTERDAGLPPLVTVQCLAKSGPNLLAGTTGGLYLSANNGVSWQVVDLGQPAPSLFCFLRVGASLFISGSIGVLVSTDDGRTWTAARTGLPSATVRALAQNGTTLIAGTVGSGAYVSTNNGATWSAASSGLGNMTIRGLTVQNGTVFAGTLGGVFATNDNGTTWTSKGAGVTRAEVPAIASEGTRLYAGTNGGGAFVSTDGGVNWHEANSGITFVTIFSFTVDGGSVYTGSSGGGVFRTTSGGTAWTMMGNVIPGRAAVLSVTGTNDGWIAGTGGGGIALSTDRGATWTNVLPEPGVFAIERVGSALIAATNLGIYSSLDNGRSWRKDSDLEVAKLAVLGSKIFAGTSGSGVFVSGDAGASWTSVNSSAMQGTGVTGLAVNGSTIFAGMGGKGVFRSVDQGATWTAANTGLPSSGVTSLASANNNVFATTASGVFWSTDNGGTWTAANSGLPSSTANSVLTFGTDVFVGTPSGVFMTRNNGATWSAVNTGWTMPVISLGVAGDEIIAGTGFGLVHRPLAEILGPNLTTGAPRLINVSSRGVVAPGGSLIVGFVVTGGAPKRLLVRGVGPGLTALGMAGAMTDPRLDVFRGATGSNAAIAAIDNWNDAPNDSATLSATAASAGAFPLAASSRDAALIGNFSPGTYTVQLTGADGGGGAVLIEIYELP